MKPWFYFWGPIVAVLLVGSQVLVNWLIPTDRFYIEVAEALNMPLYQQLYVLEVVRAVLVVGAVLLVAISLPLYLKSIWRREGHGTVRIRRMT